mmetsp:Transcript_13705/g.51262  ORF Transcript_13705/g.51262 Transcript_13705/m.51262 type:complete len:363 (-) Transcript_13705:2767-3855(-)
MRRSISTHAALAEAASPRAERNASRVSSNRRSASFRSPVASCNFKRKSSFVELLSANERSNVFTHLFASQTSSSRELARAVAVRRSPASFAVSLCAAWRLFSASAVAAADKAASSAALCTDKCACSSRRRNASISVPTYLVAAPSAPLRTDSAAFSPDSKRRSASAISRSLFALSYAAFALVFNSTASCSLLSVVRFASAWASLEDSTAVSRARVASAQASAAADAWEIAATASACAVRALSSIPRRVSPHPSISLFSDATSARSFPIVLEANSFVSLCASRARSAVRVTLHVSALDSTSVSSTRRREISSSDTLPSARSSNDWDSAFSSSRVTSTRFNSASKTSTFSFTELNSAFRESCCP